MPSDTVLQESTVSNWVQSFQGLAMSKCRSCEAVDLPRHNANFCAEHFQQLCRRQLSRRSATSKCSRQMIEFVAVSGGNISRSLGHAVEPVFRLTVDSSGRTTHRKCCNHPSICRGTQFLNCWKSISATNTDLISQLQWRQRSKPLLRGGLSKDTFLMMLRRGL